MKKLNERQQKFLDVLFEEAGGDPVKAKKLAGYSPTSSTAAIMRGLKEEVNSASALYLAQNAPKAAIALVGVMEDPCQLGVRDKMAAVKEVLDRTGLVKTEKMEVKASGGVMLMPPKATIEEDD